MRKGHSIEISMETKDIFARLAIAEDKGNNTEGESSEDGYLVVMGPKNSGKTSLKFYSVVDEPKPTAALDYVYARRSVPGSNKKAVAHIWELATTKKVLDLLKVPLSIDRLFKSTLLLVLDLSIPGDVIPSLIYWVNLIRKVIADVGGSNTSTEQAFAKYGDKHPDRRDISPVTVPLLIVGSKYETFRDEDSVKRKAIIQAVRYIAHSIGASLLFTSVKDKTLATQFRTTLNSALYKTEGKSTKEVEKGVYVPAGTDTFEEIGLPKGTRSSDFEDANFEKRMKMWLKIASEFYSPGIVENKEINDEEEKDENNEKYPEPTIDGIRKQKREELRRYKEKKKTEITKKTTKNNMK